MGISSKYSTPYPHTLTHKYLIPTQNENNNVLSITNNVNIVVRRTLIAPQIQPGNVPPLTAHMFSKLTHRAAAKIWNVNPIRSNNNPIWLKYRLNIINYNEN